MVMSDRCPPETSCLSELDMGSGDIVTDIRPKLDRWLQQIPGVTSEICVSKNAALGSAAQDP